MRKSRQINIGGVPVGGGAPVTVQSMTNTRTDDVEATLAQIRALAEAGCDIVRVAVPDLKAARAVREIKAESPLPLVADIHFDYKLALLAVENGADKIRLNPGNIGGKERVRAVAAACAERGVPIRVGVNAGSLEKDLLGKLGNTPEALCESALGQARLLEDAGFYDICVAVKSSDVRATVQAYRLLAARCDYPLHIGVTETGTPEMGVIKSSIGIGALLLDGLGDTLRVSLTADPIEEVRAGIAILRALKLRGGVDIVSCPTCGRTKIDLLPLVDEVRARLAVMNRDITVAVMGCVVNGPGEAKFADYGVSGGAGEGVVFRRGDVVGKFPQERLCDALLDVITNDEESTL
ncbi:MAG: flavodoxin-dependent (E)-4-hydroxy-3-methylbut-2-enyl-diphosphate synthase [Firmicutes bacterium]|nr:flavodoxin-dependent (E)-4-hydroxy-3-methylbut-2-enyl-diphosphate synthase [Bacillota bacterium]